MDGTLLVGLIKMRVSIKALTCRPGGLRKRRGRGEGGPYWRCQVLTCSNRHRNVVLQWALARKTLRMIEETVRSVENEENVNGRIAQYTFASKRPSNEIEWYTEDTNHRRRPEQKRSRNALKMVLISLNVSYRKIK